VQFVRSNGSTFKSVNVDYFSEPAKPEEKKGTTLIEKETVETGSVKMDVYWYYMKVNTVSYLL
jgi:hypothetical protein